mgnify:CR=1 FL=1
MRHLLAAQFLGPAQADPAIGAEEKDKLRLVLMVREFASQRGLEVGGSYRTYAGIGALVVAYLLFYRGVRVLGATRTAMYGNLQPIVALAFAWLMLGERPTPWQLLGAALITAGLLLSRTAHARPMVRVSPVSPSIQTS